VIADQVPTVLTVGNYSSRDLLEARPHVEIPAAGLAAIRSTEPARIELQRLVKQMEAATDPQNWVRLDAAFHAAIARASGNLVIVDLQATMATALARQSETLNLVAHRRQDANREHSAIVTAIAEHSVQRAEKAMSEHLAQVRRAVEQLTTGE